MNEQRNPLGNILISYHAIASIAFQAAVESYGVVGLANRNIIRGISRLLFKEPTSGVMVYFNGEDIAIDLQIVIEYGTRISSVSKSVANNVRFQIENLTGIQVSDIKVNVRDLRVSNPD